MIKFNFKNKNFVLTGAGKGIGYATLNKLYKSGANISIITRSILDVKKIKKKFNQNRVHAYHGDLSKENDINNYFLFSKKKLKKIDGLINNAGIRQRKSFLSINSKDFENVINNNLRSTFKLSQLFSSLIKKQGGSIINISSIVGPRGFENLSGYAMSKSAVNGLTKSLAVELAKKKIRVNSICPGFIKSSYASNFKAKLSKLYNYTLDRTPLNRWGTCEEVANLILFILSDESSFITGNELYIDGGWTSK